MTPEYFFNFDEGVYRHATWAVESWCKITSWRWPDGTWADIYANQVVVDVDVAWRRDAEEAYKKYIANLILGAGHESREEV